MEEFGLILQLVNSAALVILGVAFFAQKKVVDSMKTLLDIFDIKKVKEFADMREETAMGKAMNLIRDDQKIKEMATDVVKTKVDEIAAFYAEIIGEEHEELFYATQYLIKNCLANKEEEQKRFINEFLPNNKAKIYPIIFPEDSDNNKP